MPKKNQKKAGIKKVQTRENKMIGADLLPLALSGAVVAGQVIGLKSSDKPIKGGKAWVACPKCNRMFRDQAEVDRHSAGYHV